MGKVDYPEDSVLNYDYSRSAPSRAESASRVVVHWHLGMHAPWEDDCVRARMLVHTFTTKHTNFTQNASLTPHLAPRSV